MELMTHSYETPLAPIGKNIATGLIIANIIFSGKKMQYPNYKISKSCPTKIKKASKYSILHGQAKANAKTYIKAETGLT